MGEAAQLDSRSSCETRLFTSFVSYLPPLPYTPTSLAHPVPLLKPSARRSNHLYLERGKYKGGKKYISVSKWNMRNFYFFLICCCLSVCSRIWNRDRLGGGGGEALVSRNRQWICIASSSGVCFHY